MNRILVMMVCLFAACGDDIDCPRMDGGSFPDVQVSDTMKPDTLPQCSNPAFGEWQLKDPGAKDYLKCLSAPNFSEVLDSCNHFSFSPDECDKGMSLYDCFLQRCMVNKMMAYCCEGKSLEEAKKCFNCVMEKKKYCSGSFQNYLLSMRQCSPQV